MTNNQQPFYIRGVHVGFVDQIESHPSFKRGVLHLDKSAEHAMFKSVVSLAHDVDIATPEEYQARWDTWHRGCGELCGLNLSIGEEKLQIEEFSIESNWSIEWSNTESLWSD